jgi:hypothetical protein
VYAQVWGDARGTGPTLDLRSETQEVLSYSSAVGTVTEINALDSGGCLVCLWLYIYIYIPHTHMCASFLSLIV